MGKLLGCFLATAIALAEPVVEPVQVTPSGQSAQDAEVEILDQILDILNNLPKSTSAPVEASKQPQNTKSDTSSANQNTSRQNPRVNVDISILPRRSPFENTPGIPKPPGSMPSPGPSSEAAKGETKPPGSIPSPSSNSSLPSSPSNPGNSSQSSSSGQNSRPSSASHQEAGKASNSGSASGSSSGQASTNTRRNNQSSGTSDQTQPNGQNSRTSQSDSSQQSDHGGRTANNSGTSKPTQSPFPVFTDPEESASAKGGQSTQPQSQSSEGSFDVILSDLEFSILEHAQQGMSSVLNPDGLPNETAGSVGEEGGDAGGSSPPFGRPAPPARTPNDDRSGQASQPGQSGASSTGSDDKEREIPDDLKDIDNDDIVAQQLKEAAIAETDPELKERLWQEYRKYKGL